VQFVLASESPRRIELLRAVGYEFEARKSGFPEVFIPGDPRGTVATNASQKAMTVAEALQGTVYRDGRLLLEEVVLGADTVVYLPEEHEVLGQPEDREDGRRMLELLRGRVHEVYTGVAVVGEGDIDINVVRTRVWLSALSDEGVEAYVASGEGMGKAGGYAIQGKAALFVEGIEGDYTNVVGFPLATTARMLAAVGVRWY
jgi:septum formation protein